MAEHPMINSNLPSFSKRVCGFLFARRSFPYSRKLLSEWSLCAAKADAVAPNRTSMAPALKAAPMQVVMINQ